MRVLEVARDETMLVAGYENQTLECVACHEIERRQVFRGSDAVIDRRPDVASWRDGGTEPAMPVAVAGAESAPRREAPEDRPASAGQTDPGQVDAGQVDPASAAAVPVHENPPSLAAPDPEVDEAEEMLRRAIAMVRGPLRGSPVRGLTDGRPSTPADVASAVRTRKANRVVQIRHDPSYEAAYAAKDTRTGLVVLRHQDSTRLRAMCDRLGWQVIEDGAPGAED
jgi:hypothetical protein